MKKLLALVIAFGLCVWSGAVATPEYEFILLRNKPSVTGFIVEEGINDYIIMYSLIQQMGIRMGQGGQYL